MSLESSGIGGVEMSQKKRGLSRAIFMRRYSLFRLRRSFSGVPNPKGDFAPLPTLSIVRDVDVTPFGFVTTGNRPTLSLAVPPPLDESNLFEVCIQFTSYNKALTPKLLINRGGGQTEEFVVPYVSSGRCQVICTLPANVRQLEILISESASIFSIHECEIRACAIDVLAKTDVPTKPRGFDVLCFPIIDWEYRIQRPQQILRRFAKAGHRVFYVSTALQGLHKDDVTLEHVENNVVKVGLPGNPRLNLYKDQITPNSLDHGLRALKKFLFEHSADVVVLLVHLPFWLPFAKQLSEQFGWKIVYDCMDDHSGFENNSETMLRTEDATVAAADLLVTTSGILQERYASRHPNCHLIRNAGEYEHFSQVLPRECSPIAQLPRPIIGYYGALAEWFDVEAMRLAIERFPWWTFVLIGHAHTQEIIALGEYSNVHLLGEKPYSELPSYLAAFDVCTIPFRRIPLTEATNPVKLYEYFAAGKPVVSRRLPETEPYADMLGLYDTPEEFVQALERAVRDVDASRREAAQRVAFENTWEARADLLSSEIAKLFPKVAVIVISYQSLSYLRECVASVLKNTQYPNFDLIIVDNASERPVVDYLREVEKNDHRVKVLCNEDNRGFAAANNQGIAMANDAEYFVLLNNDTVTPPGWLNRLVYHASNPEIGIVGPVTNSIGNEAQISVDYLNTEGMIQFSRSLMRQFQTEKFDIKVLAMFCVAFRKEVLDKVGLLDESFGMGMFEDDDYAQRVRQAGYRVVCAEDVFVHHYGSASFSKLASETYRELFEKNRRIYESKWGEWIPHTYR